MAEFKRKIEVQAGPPGSLGKQVDNLKIEFEIHKTDKPANNNTSIIKDKR